MVDHDDAPRQRPWGGSLYALIAVLMIAAAVAGVVGGRKWGAGISSQVSGGNEIAIPSGGLIFRSQVGKVVARMDADDGGGLLILYNSAEKPVITMGGSPYGSGGGVIGLTSGKGAGASLLISGTEEGGRVSLVGKHGKPVVFLGAGDDGGEIEVSDGSGNIVWSPPASARP